MALNPKDYPTMKAAGTATLSKVGSVVICAVTTFDPATGKPNDPDVLKLDPALIQAEIDQIAASANAEIAGRQALLADIQALG